MNTGYNGTPAVLGGGPVSSTFNGTARSCGTNGTSWFLSMSGPAKKPIPPEWSEIGDGPIVAWSVGVEKKGERFKLRFRGTVLDAEEESGKRPIRSVSRLSYILSYLIFICLP